MEFSDEEDDDDFFSTFGSATKSLCLTGEEEVLNYINGAVDELKKTSTLDALKKKTILVYLSKSIELLETTEPSLEAVIEHQCRKDSCRFVLCANAHPRETSWKFLVVGSLKGTRVVGIDNANTTPHYGVRVTGAPVIFCSTCNFLRATMKWLGTLKSSHSTRPSTITYALYGPKGKSVSVQSGREKYRIFHAGHAETTNEQLHTCPFMYDD